VAAWTVEGPPGLQSYRNDRIKELSRKPNFRVADSFHDGTKALQVVSDQQLLLEPKFHAEDFVTGTVLSSMVASMLAAKPEQRPTANVLVASAERTIVDARRRSTPSVHGDMAQFRRNISVRSAPAKPVVQEQLNDDFPGATEMPDPFLAERERFVRSPRGTIHRADRDSANKMRSVSGHADDGQRSQYSTSGREPRKTASFTTSRRPDVHARDITPPLQVPYGDGLADVTAAAGM
jgi:hypothetical protein